jgi:pimeloyl-ACP methyl ester carboxylesterase
VVCGYLTVPEDRSQPAGATIRLPYAIIKSRSQHPAPDPIVFPTPGGPGGSSLAGLAGWLDTPFLDQRDVILFEQRGARYAQPQLDCHERDVALFENFSQRLGAPEEIQRLVTAAKACHDRLLGQGIRLDAYNSAASAADIEDLRRALGYPAWNLYGVSYGTRLVLATMRAYPTGVRSAILDSVYPPGVQSYTERVPNAARAFRTLFDGCATDRRCHAAYPDLEQTFADVVRQMNTRPARVTIVRPDSGAPFELLLDGDDLVAGMFRALYDARVIGFLPFLIDQLHQGNTAVLAPLAQENLASLLGGADNNGLYYSVECHEEAPFNDQSAIAAAAAANPTMAAALPSSSDLAICAIWGAGAAERSFHTPVESNIPSLILAGEYDPTTPPDWGRRAAETLPNSFFYQFPGIGHAVLGHSRCARQIAAAFVAQPAAPPDAQCLATVGGPAFVTASDVYVTPALYQLSVTVPKQPLQLGVFVLCVGCFVALVAAVPIRLVRVRTVPTTGITRRMRWLPAIIAGLNLMFVAGLLLVVRTSNPILLAFGLPRRAALLLGLPLLALVLGLVLLVLMVHSWPRRSMTRIDYAYATLALLATLVFDGFLLGWGLIG